MEKEEQEGRQEKREKLLALEYPRDDESSRQGENRLKSQVVSVKSGKRKTKREGKRRKR